MMMTLIMTMPKKIGGHVLFGVAEEHAHSYQRHHAPGRLPNTPCPSTESQREDAIEPDRMARPFHAEARSASFASFTSFI